MIYQYFNTCAYLQSINTGLLQAVRRSQHIHGTASKQEVLTRLSRAKIRTITPPGWQWR